MSSNEMENGIDNEVPAKRMKPSGSLHSERLLSQILQREIDCEIKLRKTDLEVIEENIFLTKQYLLKLRQCVASGFYKEKNQKDCLQYPPHPAVQDTFIGKRPRNYINSNNSVSAASSQIQKVNSIPSSQTQKVHSIGVTSSHTHNFDSVCEEEEKRTSSQTQKIYEVSKRPSSSGVKVLQENEQKPPNILKPPCLLPPKPSLVEAVKPPEPRGCISKKEIRIVVGNVSKWTAPREVLSAAFKWSVYTKTTDANLDLSLFVSKVVFFLHPSYKPNDVVRIESPPFKLTRHGWGEFPLKTRFFFKNPLDSPVDLVHPLKLDSKHTGLETFGGETTLDVWIHLPTEEGNTEDLSIPGNCIKETAEDNSLACGLTIDNGIKREKGNDNYETKNHISTSFRKSEIYNDEVQETIKQEVLHSVDVFSDGIIENGNSEFINFENNVIKIKTESENGQDSLEYLVKHNENVELSQLSNSFIEAVIKAGIIPEESVCNNEQIYSIVSNSNSRDTGQNVSSDNNLIINIKQEPDSSSYDKHGMFGSVVNEDDYYDECNIVDSEVTIDCDVDSPNDHCEVIEKTSHLQESSNNVNLPTTSQNEVSSSNTLLQDLLVVNSPTTNSVPEKYVNISQSLSPVVSSSSIETISSQNKQFSFIPINNLYSTSNNTERIINIKKGITEVATSEPNISLANLLVQKPIRKEQPLAKPVIYKNKNIGEQNIKFITTNIVKPIRVTTPSDKLVQRIITTQPEQLNSIEITDNGKTIATGMVPVVKVANPANVTLSTIPRKVIVRKLNGEVATILAPISQDALSRSLKSTPTQVKELRTINSSLVPIQKDSRSPSMFIVTNPGNVSNIGSPITLANGQNFPLVTSLNNVSLQQSICIPVNSEISQSSTAPTVPESAKTKRKYNSNKETKPTIIMLQKENGEVILKKQAKFTDCKDDGTSGSVLKKSKTAFGGTAPSGNKKGNGKEINGAFESKSLLPFIKCHKNNMKPSLIKLQQTTGSKISILKKSTLSDSVPGERNISDNILKTCTLPIGNSPKVSSNSSQLNKRNSTMHAAANTYKSSQDIKKSLLLNCPTQSAEVAVSWLVKHLPLVDERANISGFRSCHPYCAKTRDEFLNWPYAKQRAAEWTRAKYITELLKEVSSIKEHWTTLQVYDWARIRGFTPLKIKSDSEPSSTSSIESFCYVQPTAEIIEYIKKCKNLKEKAVVDVLEQNESVSDSRGKGFQLSIPPVKDCTPFEPELAGLRQFVNKCLKNVGAETAPEEVSPGVFYSATERMLISVFHSVAEDIIRRAYNASWMRHQERTPSTINDDDIKTAILSRNEFDFLVPPKVEKKERPPVTVLPNFS